MASEGLQRVHDMFAEAAAAAVPEGREPGVEDFRTATNDMYDRFTVPDGLTIEPIDAGGVPALSVTVSGTQPDTTVLFLHGGGYVLGNANGYRSIGGLLAQDAGARVILLDYRLAPEHPHPAALEDAIAAYRWLLADGVAPERLVIAGDSAGGGLALATLFALRDWGTPLPAAAIGMSPWVDLTLSGDSMTGNAAIDPAVSADMLGALAMMYLQGQTEADSPAVSPLFGDLAGLPPLMLFVGSHETLLDDARRLHQRALEAGVEATLTVADEMLHVYPIFASVLPEGREAIAQMGAFVAQRTGSVPAR